MDENKWFRGKIVVAKYEREVILILNSKTCQWCSMTYESLSDLILFAIKK